MTSFTHRYPNSVLAHWHQPHYDPQGFPPTRLTPYISLGPQLHQVFPQDTFEGH